MSDILENPPSLHGPAVPESIPPAAVPKVFDGAVYLPQGHSVDPGSEEFELLIRKNLPPEIVPDVLTNWRGVSMRTTRLQWFAALLLLAAVAVFLYYSFPKVVHDDLAAHPGIHIRDLTPALPLSSPYRPLYREAVSRFEHGDFNQVCRMLKPAAGKIIRERDRESYSLPVLYFKSARRLHKKRGDASASVLLSDLMEQDPDNPVWAQFYFELSPRIQSVLDYEQVFLRLQQDPGYRGRMRLHLHSSGLALKKLNHLRTITNSGKYSEKELRKYRADYDLFELKLQLSRWLLLGTGAGMPTLPDNQFDPGVPEREKALRLARKHQNSPCEDFWLARLFIAKTLCSQDSMLNHIYWNGEYHTSRDALEREIENCKQRLNGSKQP